MIVDNSSITLQPNLIGKYSSLPGSKTVATDNVVVTRLDTSAPTYYKNVFVNALAERPTLADLTSIGTATKNAGADLSPLPTFVDHLPPTNTAPDKIVDAGNLPPVEMASLPIRLGTSGNDTLGDGAAAKHLKGGGGGGDDKYVVGSQDTIITETAGSGTDTVVATVSYKLGANVEKLNIMSDNSVGTGNDLANTIRLSGSNGTAYGLGGDDWIVGSDGNDLLDGGSGNDRLVEGAGDDRIYGGDGDDTILGGDGADIIYGGAGRDKITGGAGQDVVFGGAGADTFFFGPGDIQGVERIGDFSSREGGKISLRGIDANVNTAVLEKFKFIGDASFSGKGGELRYEVTKSGCELLADVNGDGKADFHIMLDNVTKIFASDLLM